MMTLSGLRGFKKRFTTLADPVALTTYRLLSRAIPLVAPSLLRRRLAQGKETADRWREKLGEPSQPRPKGPLVWLHAVGLGEVLALRGLITSMARQQPELSFLITSTARSSGQVIGTNLPANTQHQFLPLDAPKYLHRFLEHWQPDLSIWSEQDLWPNAILMSAKRGIPIGLVNARITAASFERRKYGRALYTAMLSRMSLIAAQEQDTATRLTALGATNVRVTGSLKSAAPPLSVDETELTSLKTHLKDRKIWLAASTHPADEAEAIAAQATLFAQDPAQLLILAPRDTHRAAEIGTALSAANLPYCQRSTASTPTSEHAVYLADTYGEMGLWYRLAEAALIGGGFDDIGGHNPWEAAALGAAILYGPNTANFKADYAQLLEAQAAHNVMPASLASALQIPQLPQLAKNARALSDAARTALAPLATDLLNLTKDQT